ncbi:hypothetical protein PU634_10525 [Oceanimonas pelagia]|uniref:Uncharacterized protein n=1 Tax=Oceanimonas pelagia TaxID=3028314 RepID=A0AA50QAZ0_9GAMM|nr:hypothetical protein [Oceanimonas pelagia]WMC09551.1 hypothetical protein PU634_10525 [Oceanimonas pelagia]
MTYFNVFLVLDDGHPKYLGSAGASSLGEAAQIVLEDKGYDLAHFHRGNRTYYGMELRHLPRTEVPSDQLRLVRGVA